MAGSVGSRGASEEGRRDVLTRSDRVLGLVGVAMVLAALVLLLFGGPGDAGPDPTRPPPGLALLSPADGEAVGSPLRVTFRSDEPITQRPGGWGTDAHHVHLTIDGRELMPGPADIRPLGAGRYEWTIGRLSAGELRLRLFWSDASHRPIAGGATEEIRVELR
jgi:hypothetical protein